VNSRTTGSRPPGWAGPQPLSSSRQLLSNYTGWTLYVRCFRAIAKSNFRQVGRADWPSAPPRCFPGITSDCQYSRRQYSRRQIRTPICYVPHQHGQTPTTKIPSISKVFKAFQSKFFAVPMAASETSLGQSGTGLRDPGGKRLPYLCHLCHLWPKISALLRSRQPPTETHGNPRKPNFLPHCASRLPPLVSSIPALRQSFYKTFTIFRCGDRPAYANT
jgi:hypothetical protein